MDRHQGPARHRGLKGAWLKLSRGASPCQGPWCDGLDWCMQQGEGLGQVRMSEQPFVGKQVCQVSDLRS